MAPPTLGQTLLAAVAMAMTIMILGTIFLFILRAPKYQFSLRFMMLAIGIVAVSLGAWTAVLRLGSGPPAPVLLYDGDDAQPAKMPADPGEVFDSDDLKTGNDPSPSEPEHRP